MSCFLVDISAFEIWFGRRSTPRSGTPLETVPEYSRVSARRDDLPRAQIERLGLSGQIHLAVPDRRGRRFSSGIICHVFSDPPPHSFVRLSKDVYVEAPIPTLIRVAPRLPRSTLMQLIYQLLGTYHIRETSEIATRRPLATLAELQAYVESASPMRGAGMVRSLLRYAIEGIASPEEGRVVTLLFFPPRWGGRGLPIAESNARLELNGGVSGDPVVRYADYYWHRWKLILEYDSDEFHTGRERIGLDNARRTQLQAAGYTVVTLTNHQMRDAAAFEMVVAALLRAMGRRSKTCGDVNFPQREAQLRRELYRLDVKAALGM